MRTYLERGARWKMCGPFDHRPSKRARQLKSTQSEPSSLLSSDHGDKWGRRLSDEAGAFPADMFKESTAI